MAEKKVALVTGASRGIGQAIASTLQAQGMIVVGTATTEAGASKITQALSSQTPSSKVPQGKGLVLDVTMHDAIQSALEQIRAEFGVVNVLVNNAGIVRDNLLLRMKDEAWDQVIETNLTSAQRLIRSCLPDMLKCRWGRIVNITSVVACTGNMGQANYVASKAGLIGFGKALALEVASRNVTVNAVAPGFIDTDMTRGLTDAQKQRVLSRIPLSRLGLPSDIAAAVGFLVSESASYITGETLHVNGGMFMS